MKKIFDDLKIVFFKSWKYFLGGILFILSIMFFYRQKRVTLSANEDDMTKKSQADKEASVSANMINDLITETNSAVKENIHARHAITAAAESAKKRILFEEREAHGALIDSAKKDSSAIAKEFAKEFQADYVDPDDTN